MQVDVAVNGRVIPVRRNRARRVCRPSGRRPIALFKSRLGGLIWTGLDPLVWVPAAVVAAGGSLGTDYFFAATQKHS